MIANMSIKFKPSHPHHVSILREQCEEFKLFSNYLDPPQVTHHHFSAAAEPSAIVVGGNDLELEVGPTHVPKHDGRFNDARVGLDDEAVLALLGGRNNQAVRHLTVIPRVLVSCLCRDFDTRGVKL